MFHAHTLPEREQVECQVDGAMVATAAAECVGSFQYRMSVTLAQTHTLEPGAGTEEHAH